jgi:CTD nuclear envelope phosphatase 1
MTRRATSARPATPARWASLWGLPLHGWFEPGVGSMPVTPSPLARRASSGSLRLGKWRDELEEAADLRADALLGVGMSQAEEEDVVDFEGGEPESDDDNPTAPPATPASGLLQHSRGASATSRREGSESTRLASFLFGALASRVDDYFGPQPSSRMSSPPSSPTGSSRRRSRAPSRVDPLVPVGPAVSSSSGSSSAEEQSGSSTSSQTKSSAGTVAPDEPALVDAAALTEAGAPDDPKLLPLSADAAETATVDPPPPYTPAPPESPALASQPLSTVRRAIAAVQRALDALRRAIIALLLLPFHLLHLKKQQARREEPVPAFAPAPSTPPPAAEPRLRFAPDNKPRRSDSTGGTASSTDVEARRPLTPGVKGRVVNLVDEAAASSGDASAEESSENEPHTEDEAAARLKRRAERQARKETAARAAGIAADEQNEKKIAPPKPSPSRLLPNPHPVNPYLAKDPKARKVEDRLPDVEKGVVRRDGTLAPLAGGIPRAPASHVIHHTPKVLVLDLDETLIHSTSRSPTWSALRAGAGRRPTVSTGGSLLGLDGLGASLGLGERGVRPHQVEVLLDGRSVIYHVYKRPYVDYFLRKVSCCCGKHGAPLLMLLLQVASWYHVVIFTASVQEYADPVIDWLDQGRGLIGGRMFREVRRAEERHSGAHADAAASQACTYRNGSYLKDLALVDTDLSRVCLVDNSPMSYLINPGA